MPKQRGGVLIAERPRERTGLGSRPAIQKQKTGVLIASDRPQIRDFLERMVKKEGALVVGQARDVTGALTMATRLRPDAAFIDPYLPHTIGLDSIRLSRTGGLDAARIISEEVTNTQAILVNNLDDRAVLKCYLDKTASCFLAWDSVEGKTPLRLEELYPDMRSPSGLIFANVEVNSDVVESEVVSQKLTTSEKIMLIGGFCIFAGWFLTLTVAGALVGIPLAVAGFITLLSGIASRRIALRRSRNNKGYPPRKLLRR